MIAHCQWLCANVQSERECVVHNYQIGDKRLQFFSRYPAMLVINHLADILVMQIARLSLTKCLCVPKMQFFRKKNHVKQCM